MKLLLPSSGKHSINEIESQHFIVSPLVIEMQFCFALVYPLEIKSHLFLDNFSKHPLVCAFHEIRFAIKCAHYFHQSQFYQQSFSAITDCFQTILDGEIFSKLNFMSNECDAMRCDFTFTFILNGKNIEHCIKSQQIIQHELKFLLLTKSFMTEPENNIAKVNLHFAPYFMLFVHMRIDS